MATPTYQQLLQMLSKAESEAANDGAASVAEILATKFSHHFPHIGVQKPGRFLETVRIAGPIKHQRLIGSARRSYLKRRWTPRTRNTTYLGRCVSCCKGYPQYWSSVLSCTCVDVWCALKGIYHVLVYWCMVYGVWCAIKEIYFFVLFLLRMWACYAIWCMVYGVWCMVCVWCMVYGVWCMVYGVCMYVWCMVYGVWCMVYMVYGVWCMVYGVWCMVYMVYVYVYVYGVWCMVYGSDLLCFEVTSVCVIHVDPLPFPDQLSSYGELSTCWSLHGVPYVEFYRKLHGFLMKWENAFLY